MDSSVNNGTKHHGFVFIYRFFGQDQNYVQHRFGINVSNVEPHFLGGNKIPTLNGVQVRDAVREVVATYSIDDGSMELLVSLPSNYPLGGLTVESGKRVGVETGIGRLTRDR
jgi:hypothetical protein